MNLRLRRNTQKTIRTLIMVILISLAALYVAFPFYWLFVSSIKPSEDLFDTPSPLIPKRVSFDFYLHIHRNTIIYRYFINSTIVAVFVTMATLTLSTLGAYSLTKYRFPGRELIARLILFAYMFPGIIILLPLYTLILRLHVDDSLIGLILANLTFTLPFCLWNLNSYFFHSGTADSYSYDD